MPTTITIDPVTRIEGHLAISIDVEDSHIRNARSKGEMFRGFEMILKGRDPLDAQQITQRICGVCPVSHGIASILAQDQAYGITPPTNGRLMRNLIQAANYIQSHIIHFYHLCALDFVDIAAITTYQGRDPALTALKGWVQTQLSSNVLYPAAPFLPRYEGNYLIDNDANITAISHYLEGLRMRALAHQMAAIFAGKLPHVPTLVPGGVTETVSARQIAAYADMLATLTDFIRYKYLPDVMAVAGAFPEYFSIGQGYGNFLSYGVFPESEDRQNLFLPSGALNQGTLTAFEAERISEDVRYAYYSPDSGAAPLKGQTVPDPKKQEAYSWVKAPRYADTVMEVGPLARILIAYHTEPNGTVRSLVDGFLQQTGLGLDQLVSAMGRHAARAIECQLIADHCATWVDQLRPGQPTYTDFNIPSKAVGIGLTEAPRGALGHWLEIDRHKVAHYQCVVPTTWNCSPRDDKDRPGPVEQALIGTFILDPKNPLEAARVVRSFDPCIACAVH